MNSQRIARELRALAKSLADLADAFEEPLFNASLLNKTPTRKKPAKRTSPALERFAEFWELYPRKVAKLKAQQAWVKHGCDHQADSIIACMVNHPSFLTSDICFVPHPATWLNQRRWEDAPVIRKVETIDLNEVIDRLERKRELELEEQHAYLRESGFLHGNGGTESSFSHRRQ